MHEVLVNRLGGLSLPRKSVVRLTDRPDMTLDVYRGRKTTMQQVNFIGHLYLCPYIQSYNQFMQQYLVDIGCRILVLFYSDRTKLYIIVQTNKGGNLSASKNLKNIPYTDCMY